MSLGLGLGLGVSKQAGGVTPEHWFKFDGNVTDSGKNAVSATAVNSPTFPTGFIDDAISLDGVNQHVDTNLRMDEFLPLASEGAFTVACWIKTEETDNRVIVGATDGDFAAVVWSNTRYTLGSGSTVSGWISVQLQVNGTSLRLRSSFDCPTHNDGRWHHLAVVVSDNYNESGSVRLWLDGVEVADSNNFRAGAWGPLTISTDAFIGSRDGDLAAEFNGQIDDLRVYHRQLTESQINSWLINPYLSEHADVVALRTAGWEGIPVERKELSVFARACRSNATVNAAIAAGQFVFLPVAGIALADSIQHLYHPDGIGTSATNSNFVSADYTPTGGLAGNGTNKSLSLLTSLVDMNAAAADGEFGCSFAYIDGTTEDIDGRFLGHVGAGGSLLILSLGQNNAGGGTADGGDLQFVLPDEASRATFARSNPSPTQGFVLGERRSATENNLWYNGTKEATSAVAEANSLTATYDDAAWALNITGTPGAHSQHRGFCVGMMARDWESDDDVIDFMAAVEALQAALNRSAAP